MEAHPPFRLLRLAALCVLAALIGFALTQVRIAPAPNTIFGAPHPLPTLMPTPALVIPPPAPPAPVPPHGPAAPPAVVVEQNDGAMYITNSTTNVDVNICVGFCER